MIRPVLTENISSNNTNIAVLNSEKSNSITNLEIINYAESVADNVLVGIDKINIASVINNNGLISFNTTSTDILLTNECIIDEFDLYPLWYKCSLLYPVFNETAVIRSVIKTVSRSSPLISTLVESSDDRIVSNRIQIKIVNGQTETVLPESSYVFNKSNNTIYVTDSAFPNNIDKLSLIVSYFVVKQNIFIELNGSQISKNYYIIDYSFANQFDISNYESIKNNNPSLLKTFNVEILSNIKNTNDNMYLFTYKAVKGQSTFDKIELLKTNPYFTKVNVLAGNNRYQHIIENGKMYVIKKYLGERFYIKLNNINNEVISIIKPNKNKDELWYLDIVKNGNDPDFDVLEYKQYRMINDKRVVNIINEEPILLLPNSLKTRNSDIHLIYDTERNVSNIQILVNDVLLDNKLISDIDTSIGYIVTTKHFKKTDKVLINYTYMTNKVPYVNLQLNPIQSLTTNISSNSYKYLVFIVNKKLLKNNSNRSVFHFNMKKFRKFIVDLNSYELDAEEAINYISNNIQSIIGDYYKQDSSVVNKIRALGIVSVINSSTASSLEHVDIRVRGGGIPQDVEQLNSFMSAFPLTEYNADIVYLDGVPYPSNNVYVVRIPYFYILNLAERLRLYDEEVISAIYLNNDSNNLAIEKSKLIIEAKIKRFLPSSAHPIIEFV